MKALTVYLTQYQLLPYEPTAKRIHALFGQSISEGILVTLNNDFSELHSASTADATVYFIHPKRGNEVMDEANLLPQCKGVAVHDAWAPYFLYNECPHALCNVHHLRELQGIWELYQQVWAKDMMNFLLFAKQEKENHNGILSPDTITKMEATYLRILERGFAEQCLLSPSSEGKGRKKQTPAKNILDRLSAHRDHVLAFLRDPAVPFDYCVKNSFNGVSINDYHKRVIVCNTYFSTKNRSY